MASGDGPEQYLVTTLGGESSVTAIIGTSPTRIGPMYRAEGFEIPAVVYKVTHETALSALGGYEGLSEYSIELSCIAATYATAKNLANKVRLTLDERPGVLEETDVKAVRYSGSRDHYEKSVDGGPKGLHRVVVDFVFFSTRTEP